MRKSFPSRDEISARCRALFRIRYSARETESAIGENPEPLIKPS